MVLAQEIDGNAKMFFSVDEQILEEALETDSKFSIKDKNSFTVKKNGSEFGINSKKSVFNKGQESFLQSITESDENIVTVTTIIPYHIDEDGSLINSFEYAKLLNKNTPVPLNADVVPSTLVDVTVTVTTSYAHYQGYYTFAHYYRHAGIYAYWSSSKSLTMNHMIVRYESCGELHKYPECLTVKYPEDSFDTEANNRNYTKKSVISVAYPTEGKEFVDGKNVMPYDRVLLLTDYFNHGGLVYIQVVYTINGSKKTYDTNYYVYKK